MLKSFMSFFSDEPDIDFAALAREGAVILDVRSKHEFAFGHIAGAINIPVSDLSEMLSTLPDKRKTIITCCASGVRSTSATAILKSSGYVNVFNGGRWRTLNEKLKLNS